MLKIKELRKLKKMTQPALADASGIKIRAIQSYEAGERFPSSDKIPTLSRALGVSIGELFGEEVTPKGINTQVLSQLNDIKKILLDEVGHNHDTIIALVKSRAEEVGVDLMRELKQSKDAIKSLLDLQDKVSDERLAAARIGEVGHTAVELMDDISGLDVEILRLDTAIEAYFS